MAYSLDGNNLGIIEFEQEKTNSGRIVLPSIDGDDTNAIAVNFGGQNTTISISGVKIGAAAVLKSFRDTFKALASPTTTTTVNYVSDVLGTEAVSVDDATFTYVAGQPQILQYSMELRIVGEVLG